MLIQKKTVMKYIILICMSSLFYASCIKDDILDDIIPENIRIINCLDTLAKDSTFLLKANYFNNSGAEESTDFDWQSSDTSILTIDSNGLIIAKKIGSSLITISAKGISVSKTLNVGTTTSLQSSSKSGQVNTTSSYALTGSFVLKKVGNDVNLNFGSDYNASTALPGLFVYLSNNPNSIIGAYEIGRVTVFSGIHSYTIPNQGINDYNYVLYFCKPFNAKVGHGKIN
jgi:hypothetical protein